MVMPLNSFSSMTGAMTSGNVPQYFHSRYGDGYSDFGTRPYAQPYPMAIIPRAQEPSTQKTWLGRFIQRCFLT